MTSSTYASPSPIEKIPAWNIGMDVPLVIEGIVLATIGINKWFHENGRVGIRVIFGLAEYDTAGHRVGECGNGGDLRPSLANLNNIGACPSGGSRIIMNDYRSADYGELAEETEHRVDGGGTKGVELFEASIFSAEITDLVFVWTSLIRARGRINPKRIVMPAGP